MIRIGVIGPEDIVSQVASVAPEFPNVEPSYFPYVSENETKGLVKKCAGSVDVVLFTGIIPYYIAREDGEGSLPYVYISYTGASLYKALLRLKILGQADITRLSIDTLSVDTVEESYEEVGLPVENVYIKEYDRAPSREELVAFHEGLWHAGKTTVAVTCLRSAYDALVARGVPAYRLVPALSSIREALNRAFLEGTNSRYEYSQIGVCVLNVDGFKGIASRSNSEYQIQRTKLDLHQMLLSQGEKIGASVHFLGADEFIIVATRGTLEAVTDSFAKAPFLDEIEDGLGISASLGIGFGASAYDAETKARMALARAKAFGGRCGFVAQDSGEVIGPLQPERRLKYAVRADDEKVLALIRELGISVATFGRLKALLEEWHHETITAPELAPKLGVSVRSARRILRSLEAKKLVEAAGEEQGYPYGRPRVVYRVAGTLSRMLEEIGA